MGEEGEGVLTLFANDIQPQLIPVEINLEGWPLFSRRKSSSEKVIEVGQSIKTEDGQQIEQLWRVAASHDYSVPGPFDEDVFVGVMALVKSRGGMPKDGKIRFSTYELVKVLGKGKRGSTYQKVRESLDRIAATSYYSENAFYVLGDESLESYRFTLWTVHLSRARSKDGRSAEHHTLRFDDIIIRSYNSGYLKLLDTELYFALKIPLAKALYRLVDQRRRGTLSWSVDVHALRDLLAMSQSYRAPSRIWEVLTSAHKVLKREKFLESATIDGNTARYRVHPDYAKGWYAEDLGSQGSASVLSEDAVRSLVENGVWPNRARKLVEGYGPEKAFHALDVLSVRGDIGNRGAYVAQVVETGDPEELEEMSRYIAISRGDIGSSTPASVQLSLTQDDAEPSLDPAQAVPQLDPEAHDIWENALDDFCGNDTQKLWFNGLVATSCSDGSLEVYAPNSFARDYVEEKFRPGLEESLARVLGYSCTLYLVAM
jgi:hypothetical protein